MAIIDSDKETRRRKLLDPSQYPAAEVWNSAGQGSVTMAGQAQPPAGMVTSQPAAQPSNFGVQIAPSPAPVVQGPTVAPTQAPQQAPGGVVTPMFAPQTTPGQQQQIQQLYERNGLQAPPAPQPTLAPPTDNKAEIFRRYEIQKKAVEKGRADRAAETDRMRVRQGLKPLTPKAPAPAPAALPTATDIIPLDASTSVATKSQSDPFVKRHNDLIEKARKLTEAGKPVPPNLTSDIEKSGKQAKHRIDKYMQEDAAEQDAEQAKDDDAAKKLVAAKTDKEADRASGQLLGRAQAAVKDRPGAARKMAEEGMRNARTPTEAKHFQSVLDDITANEKAAKATGLKQEAAKLVGQIKDSEFRYKEANDAVKAAEAGASLSGVDVVPLKQARDDVRKELIKLISRKAVLEAGLEPDQPAGDGEPPVQVKNDADFDALDSGTEFIGPDGKPYRKK